VAEESNEERKVNLDLLDEVREEGKIKLKPRREGWSTSTTPS